ncbi:UMP-CMP kinase-like [Haliotis rufescens]|uniref:UMP-CMP kinase-like n=1 Tax=Haliotis rufescens TaxID=6454 RepID=UPI001EAFC8EB|nr:UMP-CMP kinase-like [Haliotis rufescens]
MLYRAIIFRPFFRLRHLGSGLLGGKIISNSKYLNTFSIPQHSIMSETKYGVVFVLGGPGAGKGTQCERIDKEFGFLHLSAGDLLREERQNKDSKIGSEIEKHIRNGTIVPVEITCSLLHRAMEKSGRQNFLIDGFPRNQDNLDGWNRAMCDLTEIKRVLFFNCSDGVCIERCLNRGKTSGRSDDNEESLKKRIITYRDSTLPVIEHYRNLNLVSEIQADKTLDDVWEEVKGIFEKIRS